MMLSLQHIEKITHNGTIGRYRDFTCCSLITGNIFNLMETTQLTAEQLYIAYERRVQRFCNSIVWLKQAEINEALPFNLV